MEARLTPNGGRCLGLLSALLLDFWILVNWECLATREAGQEGGLGPVVAALVGEENSRGTLEHRLLPRTNGKDRVTSEVSGSISPSATPEGTRTWVRQNIQRLGSSGVTEVTVKEHGCQKDVQPWSLPYLLWTCGSSPGPQ